MNLRSIKESMLFQAVPYEAGQVDMAGLSSINEGQSVSPESDIITFYLGVHILGVVETQYGIERELPVDIAELVVEWHSRMESVFFRVFTYLIMISIGESRHGQYHNYEKTITNNFGTDVWDMVKNLTKGVSRNDVRTLFLSESRDLHKFMTYLEWVFIDCFQGKSFGGKPWANISNKVTQVITGEISPFTMVDVAWALVHNGGPIFNKNTIYTKEADSYGLTQLLDMQRGGAIPSLIANYKKYQTQVHTFCIYQAHTTDFVQVVERVSEVLGVDIGEFVEPKVIHDAGALTPDFKNCEPVEKLEVGKLVPTSEILDIGLASISKMKRA